MTHPFNAKQTFELADGSNGVIFKCRHWKMLDCANFHDLPFSIRILLESALRNTMVS